MEEIINHCSYLLYNSPQAEEYLFYLDRRLTREMQKRFSFGYFPSSEHIYLLKDFIEEEKIINADLAWTLNVCDSQAMQNKHIYFFEDHPLIMPYKDVYGRIIGLVGRSILAEDQRPGHIPKYKNTEFKKGNHLFGLFEAKKSILDKNLVYVVEGQFDVIKAFEKGIENIVALGNANITDKQLALLTRYTDNIVMLLDNDLAGETGRARAVKKFGHLCNIDINQYLPPAYKDIDEYLKENDTLNFINKIF